MANATTAQIEEVQNNQRLLVQFAVVAVALLATLAMLFIISLTAVDAMTMTSLTDSMIVDARSSIFRAG